MPIFCKDWGFFLSLYSLPNICSFFLLSISISLFDLIFLKSRCLFSFLIFPLFPLFLFLPPDEKSSTYVKYSIFVDQTYLMIIGSSPAHGSRRKSSSTFWLPVQWKRGPYHWCVEVDVATGLLSFHLSAHPGYIAMSFRSVIRLVDNFSMLSRRSQHTTARVPL